ncbi:GntR family transcriptional regulator [Leucobacter insecticola]|uniref:GntR family transcriptional regulator n=1 Tax=Leucobacter insecticola TaxID=2714934 RepID=A0A6G8FL59_9MICO|nr:GntR family transcriptional regulator [Leucobacter insecticola]QIM17105.1 GntR family transcriptional regulator [Leucobacter insecticola]
MIGEQLAHLVEGLRLQGELKLPSERELAAQLGISRGGVRKGLATLIENGQVVQRVGRNGGTYIRTVNVDSYIVSPPVAPFTVSRSLNEVVGVPTLLVDQGYTPSTRILRAEERDAQKRERDQLGLSPGQRVVTIRRLRSANEVPLSLEEMTLPASVFPDLLSRDLSSIYELMADGYGVSVVTAQERIGVGEATPSAAYLLKVAPGAPLFDIERIALDQNNRPIELSRDLFRADLTRLTVTSP